MRVFSSHPALRWLVPIVAVFVLAGGGLLAGRAVATTPLPSKTPQELLVAIQQAKVDGLSGQVVQESNLGIPEIPGTSDRSADFNTLISGSHTLLVWYAGPDKARIALKGTLGESDIIKNGSDLWTWSSKDKSATHRTLSAKDAQHDDPADLPKTPQEAATKFLAAVDDSTKVAVDPDVKVAGRDAYELVLTPKSEGTLIQQVRIAVDGENYIPLRVQVYGSSGQPAAQIGFTSVDFTVPDAGQFAFNPPKDTDVKNLGTPSAAERKQAQDKAKQAKDKAEQAREDGDTKVVGSGWNAVLVSKVGQGTGSNDQAAAWLAQLPKETGSWGSGRVLRGTAFSAVLTDDGRLAIGAVTPERLFAALK